jgi:twitching motility protein PilT
MDMKKPFKLAAKLKASDLHFIVGYPVYIRVDGNLIPLYELSDFSKDKVSNKYLEELICELLNEEQFKKLKNKKDLDCGISIDNYRFRINFSFAANNYKMAVRTITSSQPTLKEIGMPSVVSDLLKSKQGLILITGPAGCGKSTTLAAMINYINKTRNDHIITLEDPVEYIFKANKSLISQRQLGEDMLSFASGLRHVLRQDPNVIMIGEMRDLETISTAITVAETGHLVLATLHTYSAAQTIDRIIDVFPAHQQNQIKAQLSIVLKAVISQRLLPKKNGGRVAAREIMVRNSAVANLIREGKVGQIKTIIETGSSIGMNTFERHIKELYENNQISLEVANSYVDKDYLLS